MDDIPADIASVDRWATLTNDQRARMLDAALLYLERAKCNPGQWLGQNVVFHPARAAYRAMVLMKTQRPADLDLISDRAWQEWAPVLADWTTTVNGALWEDKEPILERALAAARPHLADALVRVFEGAAERGAAVYAGRELSTLMDRELASRLVALLGHGSMTLSIEIAKGGRRIRLCPGPADPRPLARLAIAPARARRAYTRSTVGPRPTSLLEACRRPSRRVRRSRRAGGGKDVGGR